MEEEYNNSEYMEAWDLKGSDGNKEMNADDTNEVWGINNTKEEWICNCHSTFEKQVKRESVIFSRG